MSHLADPGLAADRMQVHPAAGYAGDVTPELACQWWQAGEAVLVDPAGIPWEDIAFPSTTYALQHYLADRETGAPHTHVTTLDRRSTR